MTYEKCPKCHASLIIYENDYMPGCREMEEVYCPNCKKLVATVFTSGIPTAEVVKTNDKD